MTTNVRDLLSQFPSLPKEQQSLFLAQILTTTNHIAYSSYIIDGSIENVRFKDVLF